MRAWLPGTERRTPGRNEVVSQSPVTVADMLSTITSTTTISNSFVVLSLTGGSMGYLASPEEYDGVCRYEGRAIMVQGHDGGGWVYSAQVVDHAGPILTAVVAQW